jgi:hypothetical protein
MSDQIGNLFSLLEELNMKATAEIFRKELQSNKVYKTAITNKAKKEQLISQISSYLNKKPIIPEVTTESSNIKTVTKLSSEETTKIMEGLVNKLAKKIENNSQTHLSELAKTSIFTKLINKFEILNKVRA